MNYKKSKLLIVAFFLLSFIAKAQDSYKKPEFALGLRIDPAMAVYGPYNNKPNDIGTTLNLEAIISIDWNVTRLFYTLEVHPAINYTKHALGFDYKLNDFPLKNFTLYTGLEFGLITREHKDYNYKNPKNYRQFVTDWILPGANIDLNYNIANTRFSLTANFNYFLAEQYLRNDGKIFRKDVMGGFKYSFN